MIFPYYPQKTIEPPVDIKSLCVGAVACNKCHLCVHFTSAPRGDNKNYILTPPGIKDICKEFYPKAF
jgi:hypothetical protein